MDSTAVQILDSCLYNLINGEKIEKTNVLGEANIVTPCFENKSRETWENIKKILPQDALKNIKYF